MEYHFKYIWMMPVLNKIIKIIVMLILIPEINQPKLKLFEV